MAQDYHIYIHDLNGASGNGGGNKTTPFSAKSENESGFETSKDSTFGVSNDEKNTETGVAALSKVAPWVAVIVAAVKITEKVLATGFAHQEEYTGNFRNNVNFNNLKAGMTNVIHPLRSFLQIKHQEAQFRKANISIEQQNKLVGNSILKDMNIGV